MSGVSFDKSPVGMRIIHHLPGRLRLHMPALFQKEELADLLTRELSTTPGVVAFHASSRTGNILVGFSPGDTDIAQLLQTIKIIVDSGYITAGKPWRGAARRRDMRTGGTLVPELLAGITTGLSWYWGHRLLALGLISVAALSRVANRQGTIPAERRINLMAGLVAGTGALIHLSGGSRQVVLATLIAGNPLATGATIASSCAAAVAALGRRGIRVGDNRTLFTAGEVDTLVLVTTTQLAPLRQKIMDVWPVDSEYTREDILKLLEETNRAAGHSGYSGDKTHSDTLNMRAQVDGQDIRVQTAALLSKAGISLTPATHEARRVSLTGGVPLFVAVDGVVVAVIGIEQKISPQAWLTLQSLRSLGIKRMVLFSKEQDVCLNPLTAASMFDQVESGLTDTRQGQLVESLRAKGHRVAVVGTRHSNGPALAQADLAIALDSFTGDDGDLYRGPLPNMVAIGRLGAAQSLRELFLQGKKLRQSHFHHFLTTAGGNVVGLALAAFGRLSIGWALAMEAYAVVNATYHWYNASQHPSRAQITATRPCPAPLVQSVSLSAQDPPVKQANCFQPALPWHSMTPEEVLRALDTNRSGLAATAVRERLIRYGYNELPAPRPQSCWKLLLKQLGDFMVQLLLGVAGISALTGRTADALTVVAIVLANAGVGVWQEMRAAQSLTGLRQLTPVRAVALREGVEIDIAARELVPGDLVLLTAGDLVPADLRLLEVSNLDVEEASLTGETLPVAKNPDNLPVATPLTERSGMAYGGSCVVRGRALGVVVAIGGATEVGGIAHSLRDHTHAATTLQKSLGELGRHMAYACLGVSALIFVLGLINRQGLFNMFITALSLAVAAIPEGLLPMVTIGLAMAVYRMSRRAMVVRRMSAVETLGCITTICVDKTGTLTKNEMTVQKIYAGGRLWLVTGEGYSPQGELRLQEAIPGQITPPDHDSLVTVDLNHLLLAGVLCNDAHLRTGPKQRKGRPPSGISSESKTPRNEWYIQGDPTEGALLVAAAKAGVKRGDFENSTRVAEEPFDARDRQMAVVYENHAGQRMLFVKGAPDRVLARCASYRLRGGSCPLDERSRRDISRIGEEMSGNALRVLALASKPLTEGEDWSASQGLVFAGLVGMQDPPRPGVRDSLLKCRRAGVAVTMITGDHPNTARAVARETGLLDGGRLITGAELDAMDDQALDAVIDEVRVCARALPRHKLRLVWSLQRQDHVVAMAGDGVNDAPAVQQADIGLAMGLTGTDLTKGVSDMIISDDNFTTIVHGIEEGRAVYDNIRHATGYLLYTNAGDVVLMLAASLLGLPMPLVPIQLLWINLSGDGLPALAIMADPPTKGQMLRPPRPKNESILARGLGHRIVTHGIAIGLAGFAAYWWGLRRHGLTVARTMALGSLGVSQFFHLFDPSITGDGSGHLSPNKYKVYAGFSGLALILAAIYVPVLRGIFQTAPLGLGNWVPVLLGAGAVPLANRSLGRLPEGKKRN